MKINTIKASFIRNALPFTATIIVTLLVFIEQVNAFSPSHNSHPFSSYYSPQSSSSCDQRSTPMKSLSSSFTYSSWKRSSSWPGISVSKKATTIINENDDDNNNNEVVEMKEDELEEKSEQLKIDEEMMREAMKVAMSSSDTLYPKPLSGAVLATSASSKGKMRIIGKGCSDHSIDAVRAVLDDTGISATPLSEWCVSWPRGGKLREDLRQSTLYLTLEPSPERQGSSLPPITQLIEMTGIPRVVIGCPNPVPELSSKGAGQLHSSGLDVTMGVLEDECQSIVESYTSMINSNLQSMGRIHFEDTGRPLGFLHCSVIDSECEQAYNRNGNAFGKNFGGRHLSFRDFGSYELAPPPESIWADEGVIDSFDSESDDVFDDNIGDNVEEDWYSMESAEELGSSFGKTSPENPWYEQVDAVVATFPKAGNAVDNSVTGRLNGLRWLATHGASLPASVERILVMDATDLRDLPLRNNDPNLPVGIDIEAFWAAHGRKKTRVLLRHGENARAILAAEGAMRAAAAASEAATRAREAIESGAAEEAAEAAIECQEAAFAATAVLEGEVRESQDLRRQLVEMGVIVEVIKGAEPIDVMNHLGTRNSYKMVVWRSGCWGNRGVQAIMDGAFQWVSAHLAVDAGGGKFWQLMLAERAVQAACGPEGKVKILAEQEDISLDYCDEGNSDCVLTVDGRPIRHVRLDCRVVVVDPQRPTEVVLRKTAPLKDRLKEEAPWFL